MRTKIIQFCLFLCAGMLQAQGLLDTLEKEHQDTTQYTSATFKHTRILLGHSVETRKSGVLEVSTISRFWNLPGSDNRSQSFVADRMSTRIGLEYAFSDRFTFGAGGTTLDGIFDAFAKYRLIRQRNQRSPLSITLFQNMSYRSSTRFIGTIGSNGLADDIEDRLSYTSQVLIARKFTSRFSAQISPTFVHRGNTVSSENPSNYFVLGLGGRYKVGNHVSIASEYFYVANPLETIDTYGAFSLGVNWELGGLILQFYMTNASTIAEDAYMITTPFNFNFEDGNFNFGFNATYNIQLGKKHRKSN